MVLGKLDMHTHTKYKVKSLFTSKADATKF